jgi:8-oxo-dGTP pyrophosphatase MutT (NUDIX family)
MLYLSKPADFIPKFEVVSLYVEYDGKILLLHRLPHKSQGNKWGVPAGKVDPNETPLTALIREVFEETGLRVTADSIQFLQSVYAQHPEHAFIYHMYRTKLATQPEITLSKSEHQDFRWINPHDLSNIPIVDDLDTCIEMSYPS